MKCRLNPNITEFFKGILLLFLVIIGASAVIILFLAFISFNIYWIIKYFELYGVCAYLMPTNVEFNTLHEYVGICSVYGSFRICLLTIFGFFGLVVIYAMYTEIRESYRWRAHDLKYKFEGIEQPWYRVLLSYIIVCDKTK